MASSKVVSRLNSLNMLKSKSIKKKLFFYHELDTWQQDNHYIRSAYVKETSSIRKCLESLLYFHNESINIYTHLIPSFFIVWYILRFLANMNDYGMDLWVNLNFLSFGVGSYLCLTSSSLFHLFKCHSLSVCKFGNQCDYFGIVMMITMSSTSLIMFAFDDVPSWRNSFIAMFITLGAICTKVTFDQKFATPLYRPYRSAMFILFGLSGSIPVIVATNLFGHLEAYYRASAGWLLLEGFFYILGAMLYAMRIPERFTHVEISNSQNIRGKFDLIGHSHQIFHVMVLIAAFCHWNALIDSYTNWLARTSDL